MTVKAGAGVALMLAAGLFASFAGSSPATAAGRDGDAASKSESATSGKSVRHGSRYLKKRYAYRKYGRAASKSAESRRAEEKPASDVGGSVQPAIPESVANAQAQMISADVAADNSKENSKENSRDGVAKAMSEAMSAKANTILLAAADNPADGQAPTEAAVTAPDQLNDVDRALQEAPPAQTVAMAQVKPAQDAPALASNSDSLDKTSLIGKIFIAFGTVLTMASAARMFMA